MKVKREKLSPKSYLKDHIFDNVSNIKKKKKIGDDDFKILEIGEHELLLINQYKVNHLKQLCSFYKLKRTGNKEELLSRIYNHLKYSLYAIKIQKNIRLYLTNKYIKSLGPGFLNKKLCINDTDFISLDKISTIPFNQFYSIKDTDNSIYGFDIISLYNYVKKARFERKKPINPYNRQEFNKDLIININKHIQLSKLLNIEIELEIEQDEIDEHKRLELNVLTLFQEINALGHYTDSNWFLHLSREQLIIFIRELYDIWTYRAGLTPSTQREIVPPHGNPFLGINLHLANSQSPDQLVYKAYTIITKLVRSSNSNENKSLGCYYVLAALTLVSEDARNSLPWLYQSVAYNPI
jgi:hypothetical protein